MSEFAEDAYWHKIVSLFRVTSRASCDFVGTFHGEKYVPIMSICMRDYTFVKIVISGCPKKGRNEGVF